MACRQHLSQRLRDEPLRTVIGVPHVRHSDRNCHNGITVALSLRDGHADTGRFLSARKSTHSGLLTHSAASSFSLARWIFSVAVRGKESRNTTYPGAL